MKSIILWVFVVLNCQSSFAEININKLFAHDQYSSVKISPTGKYLAISQWANGDVKLLVVDVKTMKAVNQIFFSKSEKVGRFYWASDERLVMRLNIKRSDSEAPTSYGELYSVDVDGKKGKIIFGARTLWGKRKTSKERLIQEKQKAMARSWASIVDPLPDDPNHILISAEPYSHTKNKLARLYKLNIYDGNLSFIVESPIADSWVYTDDNHDVSVAVGINEKFRKVVYVYDKTNKKWVERVSFDYGKSFVPLSFDSKSDSLIIIDNHNVNTSSLFRLNVVTGKRELLFSDPNYDIDWVNIDENSGSVYGIRTEPSYPKYHFYDENNKDQIFFKSLTEGFPGTRITIKNSTLDGKKIVFFVESDIDKGIWYLFDREKNKVSYITKKNKDFDPKEMKRSNPFEFMSRDNIKISAFMTFPREPTETNLPAVVLVHGGPYNVQDLWGFDSEVQMLTSLGYAVLQVNYRGSGGYGSQFEKLGYMHWGDTIQYDILDGVDYLINAGIVAKDKVCIMGSSFGGYSAVQASIIAPNKFQCAIATSGVYDLSLLYDDGNINESLWGDSYLKDVIGTEDNLPSDFSPVNRVAELQTPLMLTHGEIDRQVPIEHAEDLINQLKKYKKNYTWLELEGEGRGIYNTDHKIEYYNKLKKFLAKYNPVGKQ